VVIVAGPCHFTLLHRDVRTAWQDGSRIEDDSTNWESLDLTRGRCFVVVFLVCVKITVPR